MSLEAYLSFFGLMLAAAWTPGPNNAMLAASGVNFGFRRTLPHAAGVALGFPLMIFVVSMGLGEVFTRFAIVREVLRWGGVALLLYIAWRTATTRGGMAEKSSRRPFTFLQAAGFQWVNPKSWAVSIAITSQFITGSDTALVNALLIATGSAVAGASSALSWSAGGAQLQRWLNSENRLRIFNVAMGLMIAACVLMVI